MKPSTKNYISFMAGLTLLILGLSLFWVGFHNMDTSQNMRWLEAKLDITMTDRASNNEYIDAATGYIIGVNQLRYGIFLAIFGMYLLGFVMGNYFSQNSLF